MLSRKSITAAAVIVLSFGTFNHAQAQFQPGNVISYNQINWGDPSVAAGVLLSAHYDPVYFPTGGNLEVGIPGSPVDAKIK